MEVGLDAVTPVGAPGAALRVVIEADGELIPLCPTVFIHVTVKVYAVAGVKPVTVIGPAPPPVAVPLREPELDTAVQFEIEAPLDAPRVYEI